MNPAKTSRTKEMYNGMSDGTLTLTKKFEGPGAIKTPSNQNKFSPNASKKLPSSGTR